MDACTTEDFSVHFLTVIANFTSSIKTVDTIDRSTIITSRDNSFIFDNDGANSLFETGRSLLEHITNREEIFIKRRPIWRDNLFIVFVDNLFIGSILISLVDNELDIRKGFENEVTIPIVINSKEIFQRQYFIK